MDFPWAVAMAAVLISLSICATPHGSATTTGSSGDDGSPRTFIVRIQNDMKPSVFASVEQWYGSTVQNLNRHVDGSDQKNETTPGPLFHVYKTVFHGFATRLTPQQAARLKSQPSVLAVFPDELRQLQTTRSPQFLGLSDQAAGLLAESDSGADVIIGVLDTGISPERRSFSDGGLGPIPNRWKGECVAGVRFSKNLCNRKLIGARSFTNGYGGSKLTEVESARDTEGHGTHTASTAAGRWVQNASFFGFAAGAAVGMAPKARIAAYKVCWLKGCLNSDILAAFDAAVSDGVDIISFSIGGGSVAYQEDPIALGSFGAMEKGVFVSASAGNEGPMQQSVTNVAPWITTVGASTIDRDFPADLVLEDGRILTGASIYAGNPLPENTFYPLYYAGSSFSGVNFFAATCQPGSLDPALVRGKIVICDRSTGGRATRSQLVKDAGGAGVVIANVAGNGEGVVADAHVIPGLDLPESAADAVKAYISTNNSARATIRIRGTQLNVQPAPVLASFSSRGPNTQTLSVLKPDLIAPGVNILASWPDRTSPAGVPQDTRTTEFNILSGTSMSCPHVSGIAALLKGAHPEWTPAMIRSAMMTTAYPVDQQHKPLLDQNSNGNSTVWGIGAGHVDPQRAVDPGLVYDLTAEDYLTFLCNSNTSTQVLRVIARKQFNCPSKLGSQWDLNYPAISVVFDASRPSNIEAKVNRTVTHVSDGAANYRVVVANPKGAIATVQPTSLAFTKKGDKRSYVVKITASRVDVPRGNTNTESGSLTWTDGKHRVTSPLLVVWDALI